MWGRKAASRTMRSDVEVVDERTSRSFWRARVFSLLTVLGAIPQCCAISAGDLALEGRLDQGGLAGAERARRIASWRELLPVGLRAVGAIERGGVDAVDGLEAPLALGPLLDGVDGTEEVGALGRLPGQDVTLMPGLPDVAEELVESVAAEPLEEAWCRRPGCSRHAAGGRSRRGTRPGRGSDRSGRAPRRRRASRPGPGPPRGGRSTPRRPGPRPRPDPRTRPTRQAGRPGRPPTPDRRPGPSGPPQAR